jgi:hypothetical protein
MEAMLGIFLYNYLYPKLTKNTVFVIISCVFSSTKLEKRAEQILLRRPAVQEWGGGGKWERWPKQCIPMYGYVKMIK